LKEKLVTLKEQYRADIAKTNSEYDQRLKSQRESMVPFAVIQQSSIQIQKWKAAFATEHKKFFSLQQSVQNQIDNALREQLEDHESQLLGIVTKATDELVNAKELF
jgi:hypothetical protein